MHIVHTTLLYYRYMPSCQIQTDSRIQEHTETRARTLSNIITRAKPEFKIAVIGPDRCTNMFLNMLGVRTYTPDLIFRVSARKTNAEFVINQSQFFSIDAAIIFDIQHEHVGGFMPPSIQSLNYSKPFVKTHPFTPIIYIRVNAHIHVCTSVAIQTLLKKINENAANLTIQTMQHYYYELPITSWDSIVYINPKMTKSAIVDTVCCPIRIYNLCKLCATTTHFL
jgi:hypothetical protein